MHTKWLFKHVHAAHHRSYDPSPLAAFAFHPGEAALEVLFGVVVSLLLPIPLGVMVVFQLFAFFFNVFTTTSHHHQHHNVSTANFGLYFQWWDRMLGTNHARYAATFESNASPCNTRDSNGGRLNGAA